MSTSSVVSSSRLGLRRAAVLGTLVASVAVVAPALAATPPTLSVSPQGGAPGDPLTASGNGFEPGTVGLHVDAVAAGGELASVVVAPNGTFAVGFAVPSLPAGSHTLIACRDLTAGQCRERAQTSFRIVAAPPPPTIPPVIVNPTTTAATTTTTPSVQLPTTTTPQPTIPPVVIGPTSSTNPDPPFDPTPDDLAITTTSGPLPEAQPPGEIVPDVFVRGIEITQGIQDLHSRMPLVAGRRTTVRVHVGVDPGFAVVDGALLLQRPGQPDEVLWPDNGPISPPFERTDIDGALNFRLDPGHYAAGDVTFTAQVWSAGGTNIDDEPDSANNLMTDAVTFHVGENPTVWLVALDDGGGPGPTVTDLDVLLGFAVVANQDLLDYLPIAGVSFEAYPYPVEPGPEATEPGLWDLGLDQTVDTTAHDRRFEPNLRMSALAVQGLLGDGDVVLGMIDESIPTNGFTGWAGYGVSWTKPVAGTPSHEVGHNSGLNHVSCAGDANGNGVLDEAEAGTIDITHPTGLPPVCSLAPIDPDGYFGFTNYRSPVMIYSNDPTHPQAAFPFMGYKAPGWPDPYHWCLLLESFGVPCSPALIGVPPRQIISVDCTPQPVEWGGAALELCLAGGPDVDDGDPGLPTLPASPPGLDIATIDGEPVLPLPATVGTNAVGIETLTIAHEEVTLEIPLEPESWILVTGSVGPSPTPVGGAYTETVGAAQIHTVAQVDDVPAQVAERFATTVEDVASGLPAVGTLRLVDADGNAIAVVPVGSTGGGHARGGDGAAASTAFVSPVPWVDGATAVELLIGDIVVDTVPIAATAPEVSDVEVAAGDGTLTVSWRLSGDDPGDATFAVQLSTDGEMWLPVVVGLTATQFSLSDLSFLPRADTIHVRVVASRGGRTGTADHAVPMTAIALAESGGTPPPLVAISGVPDGPVEEFEPIELHPVVVGRLYNGADRVKVQFFWDGGPVGDGESLAVQDLLTVGFHEVAVEVTGADGTVTTARATIEVVERTSPTRFDDAHDPDVIDFLTTDFVAPITDPAQAALPGGQSCGSLQCVDDFMAACEDAGGTAVDVGPDPPHPSGVELECQQNSSQPG